MQVVDAIYGASPSQFNAIAEISDLYAPTSVNSGESFNVSYSAVNLTSATLNMFGYIRNIDNNAQVTGSYWEAVVGPGNLHSSVVPMSILNTFNGEVVIGHAVLCEDIPDAGDCVNAGCYWYDGACHSSQQGELPPWAIPALVGVGVIVILAVATRKPSKSRA